MGTTKTGLTAAAVVALAVTLTGAGAGTAAATPSAATTASTASCGAEPERSDAYAATLPIVHFGQSGTFVLGLQKALEWEGYKLAGTGNFGPATLHAVRDYQRKHRVPDTGVADPATWRELVGSKPPSLTGQGVQFPIPAPLLPGAPEVGELFNMLQRIPPYMYNLPTEEQGYGPRWQAMVRNFQRHNGIPADAVVGENTWRALITVISMSGGWGC
ncbi:peptidoglycan hydrolase-like protein with peptidoglycan-binding domain [Herbihabitans rhizosphaerae]|uniref:Peptidoglycan hydrolase-like protein with peptidoglycan-binding domain n=1 Tax=Herbihabitans rhizosphaerae TaxID=1872711 RepID=A0A4Q7L938_9PSEU|nr:peptidoglycan-binding protein [Herbihabitans rhizosphaerae]RZS44932.1 peptidoglycan hydrolase-like protein with peptidoglycan-binding domain [Herbihabitans rhizosphaerae]